MEIKDIKILIVGCGSIGKRHTECLDKIGVRNLVFFDIDTNISKALAEQYNGSYADTFEDGVEQADAVYILSPTKLHIKQAIYAVERKKHVFIEKPISSSLDGIDELSKLAKANNVVVGNAFCFRFHEGVQKMKKLIDKGDIGKVISIRAMMGEHFPTVRPDYMDTYYVKYSGAFELVHDVDLAIYMADQPIQNFSGLYGSYGNMGFQSPDTVEIILQFEKCLANVHLDFFQKPRTRTLDILGEKGNLRLEFADWNKYTISRYFPDEDMWKDETFETTRNDMFVAESMNFLNAILGKEPIAVPVSEAVKSLKVVNGVYKESC